MFKNLWNTVKTAVVDTAKKVVGTVKKKIHRAALCVEFYVSDICSQFFGFSVDFGIPLVW